MCVVKYRFVDYVFWISGRTIRELSAARVVNSVYLS